MKSTLLFLVFLVSGLWASAQLTIEQIPSFSVAPLDTCRLDSSQKIYSLKVWELYQTKNDEWDGPIDSSRCIGVQQNDPAILLSQIDTARRLFIRFNGKLKADSSQVYYGQFYFSGRDFSIDSNKSEIVLARESRWKTDSTDTTVQIISKHRITHQSDDLCLVTGKFHEINYTSWTFGLKFKNVKTGASVGLRSAYVERRYQLRKHREIKMQYALNDSTQMARLDPFEQHLVVHHKTGIPSGDNFSYTEVSPVNPLTKQIECRVDLDRYSVLHFQRYTALRGATYDSLGNRHKVNLIMNDHDMCLPPFFDVIMGEECQLTYNSGHIDLNGDFSCVMLRNGGKLVIGPNAHLHYGIGTNAGILMVKPGSTIEFEKDAKLTVYNQFHLKSYSEDEGGEIHVYLKPGNELNFEPDARLTNKFSANKDVKLVVHMMGGHLNDENLIDKDRNLIERVEYDQFQQKIEDLTAYPNPTSDFFRVNFQVEDEFLVSWTLQNTQGRVVSSGMRYTAIGANHLNFDCRSLSQGIYFLNMQGTDIRKTIKVVVNH